MNNNYKIMARHKKSLIDNISPLAWLNNVICYGA